MIKLDEVKPKPARSSRTIRIGGLYIAVGTIAVIAQALDFSESILTAVGAENVPPDVAVWGGLLLAIIGAVQVWLRTVTDQPIGKPPETGISEG